jgi:hypothetical protein
MINDFLFEADSYTSNRIYAEVPLKELPNSEPLNIKENDRDGRNSRRVDDRANYGRSEKRFILCVRGGGGGGIALLVGYQS